MPGSLDLPPVYTRCADRVARASPTWTRLDVDVGRTELASLHRRTELDVGWTCAAVRHGNRLHVSRQSSLLERVQRRSSRLISPLTQMPSPFGFTSS